MTTGIVKLVRFQPGDDPVAYFDRLVTQLEQALSSRPLGGPYQITVAATLRTFNSGTATATDTANFVATLATELRRGGLLG